MDKATETWLEGLSKSTRNVYRHYWNLFKDFTKKTGDQMLKEKKVAGNGTYKALLFQFREWLKQRPKPLSEHSIRTAVGTVRGFFSFHETPIILRRTEKMRLKKAKRKRLDYKFSQADLRKIAMVSKLKEKYIVLVGKSLGLRASDFIRLTYGHFRALNLNEEPPVGLGEIDTQKEGVLANPFLDSDAIPVIQQILDSNRNKSDNERVLSIKKTELTTTLQRVTKRANVSAGNKHIRFHGLRKFLIDRLSAYASESQWKQIIGKAISEGAYVSTEQLKPIFARAMKDISCLALTSNNIALRERLEELEKENESLRNQIKGFRILFEDEIRRKINNMKVTQKSTITSGKERLERLELTRESTINIKEELERIGRTS